MDEAESIRQAMFEAGRTRDMMWDVVLLELESRDPAAACDARIAARPMRVRPLVGFSTHAAALAWPYLDYQARSDWLWVCRTLHYIWIRDTMEYNALSEC